MRVPIKFEIKPSPSDYNLKSTIELNKERAYFMGSPKTVKADGSSSIPFNDLLGDTNSMRKT